MLTEPSKHAWYLHFIRGSTMKLLGHIFSSHTDLVQICTLPFNDYVCNLISPILNFFFHLWNEYNSSSYFIGVVALKEIINAKRLPWYAICILKHNLCYFTHIWIAHMFQFKVTVARFPNLGQYCIINCWTRTFTVILKKIIKVIKWWIKCDIIIRLRENWKSVQLRGRVFCIFALQRIKKMYLVKLMSFPLW